MVSYEKIVYSIAEECSDKLSDWESNFINSVIDQDFPLTDRQKEIVLKINRKYRKCN